MANKRMFLRELLKTDRFLSLSTRSQALYVALNMEADDEGIISSPDSIRRSIRARREDMDILEEKGFIFRFSTGSAFITHWWAHNTFRKDRFIPSIHRLEADYIKTFDPLPVGYPDFLKP